MTTTGALAARMVVEQMFAARTATTSMPRRRVLRAGVSCRFDTYGIAITGANADRRRTAHVDLERWLAGDHTSNNPWR